MARERDNPHRMEAPSRRRLAWLLPALTCLMLLGALILDNQRSGYATGGPSRAGHVDAGRSPSLYSGRPYVAPSRIEAAADARESGARRHPPPAEGDRDAPALRTSLPAAPGNWSTLQGMLVEADGSPAKDGRIRWVPVQPDGTRMGSDEVKADADGRFSLRARAGERVELEGRSRTSVPTHLERAWPIDGDLGRLTLQPGCTLVGWIQSGGSSRLVGSVSVQPLPASLQSHLAAGIDPGRAPPGAIAPGPLVGGRASVGADGRWQVDGLRPGLYRVMIEDVHMWDERKMPPDVFFESAPLHAALREACARVVEVPGPEVRIPLAASITHVLIDRSAHLHERPDSAMVSATDAEGVTSETKGWFNADWSDELDDSSLTLAAGQPYRLRVWANGFEPLELDHVAGAAGDVVVVPVRLRPVPRSMLRLSAPEQRSQGPGEGMVELRDLAKHERVFWEAFAWKDLRPLELVVPSGAWTLVVTPWSAPAASGGDFDLPYVRTVLLRPDEATSMTWDPPQGGRFELRAERRDGERRALDLRVERPGAPARRTLVRWDREPGAMLWSDALETARTFRSQDAYPEGALTLHVESPACVPQRVLVRIRAREVTPVRVTLEPR